jgi:hypothetical protein
MSRKLIVRPRLSAPGAASFCGSGMGYTGGMCGKACEIKTPVHKYGE